MKYIRIDGDHAWVSLTQGHEAQIDIGDVPLVSQYSWHVVPHPVGGFYARCSPHGYMHRLITGAPKGKDVDHVNHDTLDNRRANLRVGTHFENMQNSRASLTTHCPAGHPYDERNTHVNKKGHRICRECARLRMVAKLAVETPEQREQRIARCKAYYLRTRTLAGPGRIQAA